MSNCKKCGSPLQREEIALHLKLVDRTDSEYLCLDCMADYFECERSLLEKKIEHFKNTGCFLFCEE